MAEPNYMAYAQYMGARNPLAVGINQISGTLSDLQKQGMVREDQARRNSLADLQMQQGQMQMQATQGELADQQARRGAMQSLYGVNNPQDAYLAEMKAKQEAAKKQQRAEMSAKHLESIKTYKALGVKPEFLTEYTKAEMMKDPELAPMAKYVSFADDTKMEITKPFKDGELRDPLNPQGFLPAGTYKVIGTATGNPADPYRFDKIEPVIAKPDAMELLIKREELAGARQDKQIAAADRRAFAQINAMDRRQSQPRPEPPGKVLPAGQVEAIADMKRVKDVLAEAGQLANSKNISTGPVKGRLQSLGSKVGMASDDFTNLNQKLASAENIMLKLRSGAAVTDQEFERFKREFPNVNDPPAVRNRKLDNAIKYANELMDSKVDLYEESGYKVPKSVKSTQQPQGNQNRPAQESKPYVTKGGFKVTVKP